MIRAVLLMGLIMGSGACDKSEQPSQMINEITGDTQPDPLVKTGANTLRGKAVFVERDQGHCVLCHQLASVDAPFQGNLGPRLDGVGARLSTGQLRLRITAPHIIWPDTIMPAYFRRVGLNQVDPNYEGETILTGQQIEDLVAFLSDQTEAMEISHGSAG
ncbi:MAG: sulfur oxidation c-type cytochrome SoxX [Pseudomonadota bacterium]